MSIDTENKDAPVCPHCGFFNDAAWRVGSKYVRADGLCRDECRSCGRAFVVSRQVTVTYSTRAE